MSSSPIRPVVEVEAVLSRSHRAHPPCRSSDERSELLVAIQFDALVDWRPSHWRASAQAAGTRQQLLLDRVDEFLRNSATDTLSLGEK